MLRSVSRCLLHTSKTLASHDCQRLVQRSLPAVCHCARSINLSARKSSDDPVKPETGKFRARGTSLQKNRVSREIKEAVVNVAKSLPGDWTKTAEELLTRLQLHENPEQAQELAEQPEKAAEPDKSLLKTLEIGRSFSTNKARNDRMQQIRPRTTTGDRVERYELYQMPRLGIFDAKKLQKKAPQQVEESHESDDLWIQMDAEKVRKALGAIPRNAFEEMIQLTKAGKLWKFPIDNEAGMDEERKYKFQEHVFLERHLREFPSKGPIRKFMELVTLGLSRNPWISVPEKIEHIRWFADYFREKQDILESSIGEQGRMNKPDERIE